MTDAIKSGQEIVQDFFSEILTIEGVDAEIALTIQNLFNQDKLTNTLITQKFSKLREKAQDGKS